MKILFAAGLAALSLAATGARAQAAPADPPSIVINATGTAEAPAEYANLSFKVRGEGKTKVDALKAMTLARQKVEASLPNLAGAGKIELSADSLAFSEIRPDNCARRDYDNAPTAASSACAVSGYIAVLDMEVRLWPAEKLGDAASLAAQLGADSIEPGGGGVSDMDALQAQATKAALDNARKEADRIAAASGGRLGRILRIQDPSANDIPIAVSGFSGGYFDRADRTSVSPVVSVDLKLGPITARARYVVVFELLK